MNKTLKIGLSILAIVLFAAITVNMAFAFTYQAGVPMSGRYISTWGQTWRPGASSGAGRYYPAYGYSGYYYPSMYDSYRPYPNYRGSSGMSYYSSSYYPMPNYYYSNPYRW